MSDTNGNGPASTTATEGTGNAGSGTENSATENGGTNGQPKPTETLEYWKNQARENEKRAKSNADAARELEQIKESQKTQAQKDADKLAAAAAEVAAIPTKVAESLKAHLVDRHKIDAEDAELFLTATDPDLLLKQVDRLLAQSDKGGRKKHVVSNEGTNDSSAGNDSDIREFTRNLFGNNN